MFVWIVFFFPHLISKREPQHQPDFSSTWQRAAGCHCLVRGSAGARHALHSLGQLRLAQLQQQGQILLPGTHPGPSWGAASLLPHHTSC